ncbi:MAG TPA: hypothetical protein PLZ24_16315 [Flavobacteriales bacterium]|nr:hypothetical protein [Flavobacteriales bacterium]
MTKNLGYILAAVIALLALGYIFWPTGPVVPTLQVSPYQDTIRMERDTLAMVRAEKVLLDSSIARTRRERDRAIASRPPMEKRHRDDVAHFDTLGIGAAIDSLNARPIAY